MRPVTAAPDREDAALVVAYANKPILRAARAKGATYVSTYAVFKGADGKTGPTSLLAADGDHPNARGHQRIAQVLARVLPNG